MLKLHIADRIRDITIEHTITKKRNALKEYRELKNPVGHFAKHILKTWQMRKPPSEMLPKHQPYVNFKLTNTNGQWHAESSTFMAPCRQAASPASSLQTKQVPFVEMTSKSDMEWAIITENKSKFMDTPFMQQPLLGNFGYLGISSHAEVVMKGSYDIPDGVDSHTKKFTQQLAMEPAIQQDSPIQTYFTTEDWKQGWRKAKERMSSASYLFLHFGHFKAGCMNNIITNFEATMANIPILSGYIPRWWYEAVDCMLLKKTQ